MLSKQIIFTQRIAIGIEYAGDGFNGWQAQTGCKTIQAEIEIALSAIANQKIICFCAGRTDSGVHALQQVAHFDTHSVRTMFTWVKGANAILPKSVRVIWAHPVSNEFHARYSALNRSYVYLVNNQSNRAALWYQRVTTEYLPLTLHSMQAAANFWLGEQDFACFKASSCQSPSSKRKMLEIKIVQRGQIFEFRFKGNAFLHHMVRNMVGTLLKIGRGERTVEWAREVLLSKDRREAGPTAAARGLYFTGVEYPISFELPMVDKETAILF